MRSLVVIPTYDEALNIATAIERVRAAVPDADILVVDDNSPDGTAAIAEGLGVRVLHRPGRQGLGRAYVAGWSSVLPGGQYDVIISMDADGSHDPTVIPSFLAAVDAGADLVVGSRYVPGGSAPDWAVHRRMLSVGGSKYASAVLGLGVHDATGGFRAYRLDLLRRIDPATVRANGYGFQIETLYRAVCLGATVVEVPITFSDRRLGTSKMTAAIVWEALGLVTWWGVRDLFRRGNRGNR